MRTAAAFFLCAATLLGLACVGDDPEDVAASSSSGGIDTDGAASSGNASSSSGGSSGAADGAVGHTGGGTLAQLLVAATATSPTLLPTHDGGLVMAFPYSGPAQLVLADATIPCTSCAVIAKLDATLSHVAWFAYGNAGISPIGAIAQSPDGRLYWALEAPFEGTATINGSAFASTPRSFTVVSGAGLEGAGTGGTRLVAALNDDGTLRWVHELRQSNTGDGNVLGGFGTFAASDGAVFSTFAGTTGDLQWTNPDNSTGARTVASRYLISELDAETGAASIGPGSDQLGEHDEFGHAVGIAGYSGKGFAVTRSHYAAGSNVADGTFVSLGPLGAGALTSVVSYAAVVPAGSPNEPRPARYEDSVIATSPVPTSLSFGDAALQAGFGSTDSAFFVLDSAAAAVKGQLVLGGAGDDAPVAMLEIPGAGEVYLVGRYRSSDMQVLAVPLPPPADALTDGMYVVRAAIDPTSHAITPLWARGFTGNPGGFISVKSASADAVTGDLYVTGSLGGDGTFDFGSEPVATDVSGNTLFVLRFERGR